MNVYMGLLQERDTRLRKLGRFPKCHFFNTFFINKLYKDDKKYVYNNVRRWTTKMRLERWGQHSGTVLECDKLIIPVHLGCHWTCAVISLRDRGISYFDSLGGKEHEIVESLAKYVTDEYDNKLKEKVDTSDWSRRIDFWSIPLDRYPNSNICIADALAPPLRSLKPRRFARSSHQFLQPHQGDSPLESLVQQERLGCDSQDTAKSKDHELIKFCAAAASVWLAPLIIGLALREKSTSPGKPKQKHHIDPATQLYRRELWKCGH
ncbi:TPA: hypothetical protein ACH3X3_007259 [Trebouxia sp. C0006]